MENIKTKRGLIKLELRRTLRAMGFHVFRLRINRLELERRYHIALNELAESRHGKEYSAKNVHSEHARLAQVSNKATHARASALVKIDDE